jgi:putative transcriptional regulator
VIYLRQLILAIGGFLVAATLLGAVPPKLEQTPEYPTLVGQLLVASPKIEDPRFQKTVILIVRHSKEGAFGITINRAIGEHSLASLLEILGEKNNKVDGNVQIFAGGPVQPEAAFVIHTTDYHRSETIPINGHVAVTSSREVFQDIGHNKGPRKTLIAFGYAGWGPGQLEAELAHNDWFTAMADVVLIFEERRERVWDTAMERRSRDL